MTTYIWKDRKVIETMYPIFPDHLDCYLLITHFPTEFQKYGYYRSEKDKDLEVLVWYPVAFSEFPAEFKTQLLLLGVS